jgi:hypothetical protein
MMASEHEGRTIEAGDLGSPIRFPVLAFSQSLIYVINNLDAINICTKAGFKTGYYKKLVLIDSAYRKFKVIDAREVRTLFRLSVFDLLGLLEFNPRWQVELVYAPPTSSSLDEVKQIISKAFTKDRYSWEEMMDFEEFRDKIAAAASMEAIFEVFKEFNQA